MILWVVIGAAYLSATPISLEEVKTESRRNVQAVNAELDRARATANIAGVRSAALPQLQLYSSDGLTVAGRQRVIQPTTLPDGGVLIGPADIPPYSNPQLSLGVALNQILFDWGRWKQIAQAGSQEEASRGQAVEQLQFAEYEGVRRFFALYSAQRSLAVLEANATRSQQLVDRAQALFTAGRGSRSDVLASQVNLNNDRITAVRQHTAITQTSADLSAWLARPETEELDAVEPPGLDGTPIPPPSLEEALNTARSSRPLLKVVAAQLKASDLGVEVAKSGYLPRLTLSVNYSRSGVSANPVFTDPTRQNSATGTVNLAWDFFNGLATLAAGLQAHAPQLVGGVGFIVGIDRFMSEARALTNFTGNAVATVMIGSWTKELDRVQLDRVLDKLEPFDERTMLTHGQVSAADTQRTAEKAAQSEVLERV